MKNRFAPLGISDKKHSDGGVSGWSKVKTTSMNVQCVAARVWVALILLLFTSVWSLSAEFTFTKERQSNQWDVFDLAADVKTNTGGQIEFDPFEAGAIPLDYNSGAGVSLRQHSVLVVIGVSAAAILLGYLSFRRRSQMLRTRDSANDYLKSSCPACCGAIEFPVHGLGEWIDCPHCGQRIQLQGPTFVGRVLGGLGWSNLNWKWALVLVSMMACTTALFIYLDHRSQSDDRINPRSAEAFLDAPGPSASGFLDDTKLDVIGGSIPPSPNGFQQRQRSRERVESRESYWDRRRRQRTLDQIKNELERANQILEDEQWNRIRRESQERLDQINRDYQVSLNRTDLMLSSPAYRSAYRTIDSYDPDSLANPYGAGSPFKADGLMNPYSQYGSPYSSKSWRNPYATDAPKLFDSQGNYKGKLSANPFDPDSTSNPYGRYGSPYSADSINNPYGLGSPYSREPVYVVPSRR